MARKIAQRLAQGKPERDCRATTHIGGLSYRVAGSGRLCAKNGGCQRSRYMPRKLYGVVTSCHPFHNHDLHMAGSGHLSIVGSVRETQRGWTGLWTCGSEGATGSSMVRDGRTALHDPDTAGKSWKLAVNALNMNGGDCGLPDITTPEPRQGWCER
jgi:hypothetical protein